MTKYIYSLVITASMISSSLAQDPQFSLFAQNPLLTNPANTGVFDGRIRAKLAYRDQWSSVVQDFSFKTYNVSYDQRISLFGSELGIGGTILRDEVGKGRYSLSMAQFNVSYILQIGGSSSHGSQSYISSGLYAAVGQNSLNWNKLWFERQFNTQTGFVDTNIDNGEGAVEGRLSSDFYPDFGFGFTYFTVGRDGLSYQAGLSVQHITQPNIGLLNSNNASLYRKITVHGQASIRLNSSDLILYPSAIFMKQGPSVMSMLGSQIGIRQSDFESFSVRGGAHLRISRSFEGLGLSDMILSILFEMQKVKFGIAYDVTLSDLNLASRRRGALELNVAYILPSNKRRAKRNYPSY